MDDRESRRREAACAALKAADRKMDYETDGPEGWCSAEFSAGCILREAE